MLKSPKRHSYFMLREYNTRIEQHLGTDISVLIVIIAIYVHFIYLLFYFTRLSIA